VTNGPEAISNRNQRLKRSVRLNRFYDHTLGAFSKRSDRGKLHGMGTDGGFDYDDMNRDDDGGGGGASFDYHDENADDVRQSASEGKCGRLFGFLAFWSLTI
jgi:hypothetical protein